MELNTTSPGRPAPYGRACLNCSRAKCKCILRNDGECCERCHRLNKECKPSPTVRKRKSRVIFSQTARLEQKLDGLVSLLKSTARSNPASENVTSGWNLTNANAPTPTSNVSSDRSTDPVSACLSLTPLTPASSATSRFPYALPRDVEPTAEEAEYYFEMFRKQKLKYFAFTYFPEDITAQQLRQERPFLWLCIMAISSTVVSKQLGLGRAIREIAGREILVEGERHLDLIMGLLCFVGWGQYQVYGGPLLTVFSHLCISLTLDMELHKPAPKESRAAACAIHTKIQVPETRTMEHRRLALACYLLSSITATFHHKAECLSWSRYLSQCLQMLEDVKEFPSDEFFVYQIRLQRIIEKTTPVVIQIQDMEPEESNRLIGLYVRALRSQLAEVTSKIPSHLAGNLILQLQALSTEVAISEIPLHRTPAAPIASESAFQIIECLYSCLQAIKSWFDIFLKFDPSEYLGISMSVWKQLGGKVFLLYRLMALDDPAWDRDLVRRTANLSQILDQITTNLQHVAATAGWKHQLPGQEDVFLQSTKVIGMLKAWAESIPDANSGASNDQMQVLEDQQSGPEQLLASAIFPSFDQNDLWSKDILGLWDIYSGRTFPYMD
ncbi:hypothetical protein V1517DRAFT_310580 [Lipomyces orientalis]|uniref:Uncharacterized protein n=1 Tax=Lipomyces orientalis TaxID=1233043 RepID=A0ACC3TFG3_9ASCO